MMLKLKLQSFGHLMGRTDSFERPLCWNDWRQEEKGTTEDEMVGRHYQLDGHDFEQAPGVGDGQGSLACCSPLGLSQTPLRDWTDWLTDWCFIVIAQLLSCVRLLATLWTIACQAPLFFTISQSLLRFLSIESLMLSKQLIFCRPLLLSIFMSYLYLQIPPPSSVWLYHMIYGNFYYIWVFKFLV